jgi:TetR/AcrR family transcriptional regulator, transcriptional repressor for nem operon
MPWPKAHKKETRERVLDAAAAAFRERGIDDVSVGEVMDRAGLTHGGFYAHFKSKDELVAEALAHVSTRTGEWLGETRDLKTHADKYLSPMHLAHPEKGCAIAALGTELARSTGRVHRTFAVNIQTRLELLRELIRKPSRQKRERAAAGALACMVGGMIIARGLGGTEGDKFLAESRAFLGDALSELPERSSAD